MIKFQYRKYHLSISQYTNLQFFDNSIQTMGQCCGINQTKTTKNKLNNSAQLYQSSNSIPNNFICPITGQIMQNPVITQTGQSYQKTAIEKWFKMGRNIDPKTGVKLESMKLIPNIDLRNAIQQFVLRNPVGWSDDRIQDSSQSINLFNPQYTSTTKNNKPKYTPKEYFQSEPSVGITKCPNGHFLKKFSNGQRQGNIRKGDSYICDDCMRNHIQKDKQFYFCNACDFDICANCRQKNRRKINRQ